MTDGARRTNRRVPGNGLKGQLANWPSILYLLSSIFMLALVQNSPAQTDISIARGSNSNDTNPNPYYVNYTDMLTTRVYGVTKFNSIQFTDDSGFVQTYRPHTNMNLGLGINYRGLGLNFAFRTGLLPNDDGDYGTTEHLNFNANIYARRLVHTAFFEFYKGYYVSDNNSNFPPGEHNSELVREDLRFSSIGLTSLYVFNHKKLSYRATFTQDAWQQRSAGSFLMGLFLNASTIKGDSAVVLENLEYNDDYAQVKYFSSIDLGPLVGYVHNFVIDKHVFVLIQLTAGVGYNYMQTREETTGQDFRSYNTNLRTQARMGLGYNSERFYMGLTYVNEYNTVFLEPSEITYNIGQFRINFVYRFRVNLPFADKVMDTFHWFFLPKQNATEAK